MTVAPRGSGSDSKSPPPSIPAEKGNGKAPAHEGHSTRLFGVDLHQKPGKAPAHGTGPSTRLFGVSVAPGKPPSPKHSSQSLKTHTEHDSQKEHATLLPHMGRHFAALHSSANARKRPWPVSASVGPKHGQKADSGPSVAKPRINSKWWKVPGGRPYVRRPPGESPRYEVQRRVREKKKLKMLAAPQADEHPPGHHPSQGGGGPGSPGTGSNAVSKRRSGK